MTTKQRMSILLERWPRACRAQGWNPQDRDLRLQVIGHAVGRQVKSMNDLDNAGDIDAVYAHLGRLADNVAATLETLPAPTITIKAGSRQIAVADTPGVRRRLLWNIQKWAAPKGGEHYVLALPQCAHICTGISTLTDLSTKSLYDLIKTLRNRVRTSQSTAPATEPVCAESNNPF